MLRVFLLVALLLPLLLGAVTARARRAPPAKRQARTTSYLRQANRLYNRGKYRQAIRLYKRAMARGENPTLGYFNMGNAYFQLGSLSHAIVYYQASIDAAPDFFMSRLNLAVAYYMSDEIGECIALLKRALELKPGHLKANMLLAAAYRRAGDLPRAAVAFERIYRRHPHKKEICLTLGEIYRELDDPVEAARWLLRYPRGGKQHVYVLQVLAELYEGQGELDRAIFYLREVCSSGRKKRWAHYQLVLLLQRTGHALVALSEAEKALELYKDFAELALFAGNVAFKEKLYSRAERHYQRAVKLGSPSAVIGLENIRILRMNAARERGSRRK
jgi:tetratricopeptide (TPR) repeat protein